MKCIHVYDMIESQFVTQYSISFVDGRGPVNWAGVEYYNFAHWFPPLGKYENF